MDRSQFTGSQNKGTNQKRVAENDQGFYGQVSRVDQDFFRPPFCFPIPVAHAVTVETIPENSTLSVSYYAQTILP